MQNRIKFIKKAILFALLVFTLPAQILATGEASTYFQVFVPPSISSSRPTALIVTAIYDNTTFQIVDDNMDGDSDDSFSGVLQAGQSYVLYMKDNGVNDDKGGKSDGDYFIITASNVVLASQSSNSDWQHDWVPATNKTSKGQKFYIYSPETSYSKRDLNVYAFQDSTTVTITKISNNPVTTTGYTQVDLGNKAIVAQRTINIGEDIIFYYQDGRDIMETGETYMIEANKPITTQYGALHGNARDGGGYVPSDNGSSSGELFYFTVHTQSSKEQEIRIVSWDDNNSVTLDQYKNGQWKNVKSWNIDKLEAEERVGKNNIDRVFRVTCTPGKTVSVFEANWLETGSPGTSDISSMVSAKDGTAAGKEFLVYMAPPGTESHALNPFTGTKFSKATHAYIFAKDSTVVTVKDANTNGGVINRTYNIAAGEYADCFLDLAEWKSIYNGDGNLSSGSDRPYLLVTSTGPISVMTSNFNDNWMNYFGTSKTQDFELIGSVVEDTNPVQVVDACFEMGDTAKITSTLSFANANYPLIAPNAVIEVPNGVVVLTAVFKNITDGTQEIGELSINSLGKTIITYPNLPDLDPSKIYQLETRMIPGVNYYDGTPIGNETMFAVETNISGTYNNEFQQASAADGILICTNYTFPENLILNQENSWSVAWGDYDNDCDPDLFITNYDNNEANGFFKNNGDGTFTEVTNTLSSFDTDLANSTGASWGDYDNDGDLDLFVANNIGFKNYLYRNDGSDFIKISNDPIVNDIGYVHGSGWVDYDNDGYLDMFTAEFFATRFNNLYHNNGDGTFEKVTNNALVLDAGSSVSSSWSDYDNDGDLDVFVCNTNDESNYLYRNDGNGNFVKIISGAIVTDGGKSVGASWGDYDNDGFEDLFVANAGGQNNFLYHNNGDGTFTKITNDTIVKGGGDSHGSGWADIDNDGDLDLYVSNDQGAINFLYMNNGDGTFSQLDHRLSLFTSAGGNSFGSAWADYDLDGDLDLFIANHQDQANILVKNEIADAAGNNFITVKLNGTNSNSSAIGARIAVKATINGQATWQYRTVLGQTGGGIGGQSEMKQFFGLGDATMVDSIVIRWPSGYTQVETNQAANQGCYQITETPGSEVSGTVFHDKNQNCIQDSDEPGIPNIVLEIMPGNIQVTTDSAGFYKSTLGIGSYTVKQFTGGNWNQSCPANDGTLTVDVTQIGTTYPNNNFADTASCKLPDLAVNLSTTALRVGFENLYAVNYTNYGTEDATGVVLTVDFGPHIKPINGTLPWDNVTGTVYTWNLGTVGVNENVTIFVADSVLTTAVIGDDITVSATILGNENDCDISDNTALDINEAVGAVDPNDITVYPNEGYITNDQELTYRIRFQNVGNDLVSRVILRDELPENLDLETLELGEASHAFKFSIEGDRTLVWDFDNINLVDSTTNEPESHGYVFFRIQLKQGLKSGDKIQNTAAIYFDNSEPVITNTVENIISGNPNPVAGELSVWPNPVIDYVNIKLESLTNNTDERISKLYIFNAAGVMVHSEENLDDLQVRVEDRGFLNKGMYFVKVISNVGNEYKGKIVVVE